MWTSRHRSINEREKKKKNLKKKRRSQFIAREVCTWRRRWERDRETAERHFFEAKGESYVFLLAALYLLPEHWAEEFPGSIFDTVYSAGIIWYCTIIRPRGVFFPRTNPERDKSVVACWLSIMRTDRLTPCNLLSTYTRRQRSELSMASFRTDGPKSIIPQRMIDKSYVLRTT